VPAVEISRKAKAGLGLGGAGVVEDLLLGIQWFACPISRDFGKQAMLDGIPLRRAGRVVGYGYSQGEGIGELELNFRFPGITAAAVTAPSIGEN
jgi:hypothetical protein